MWKKHVMLSVNMLGVEKSTILESPDPEIVKVKFRGQPTDAINRFTFINTPRIQIELVEPDTSSPSTWQEHLEKYGESAHHIAFWVDSVDEKKALLNELASQPSKKDYSSMAAVNMLIWIQLLNMESLSNC